MPSDGTVPCSNSSSATSTIYSMRAYRPINVLYLPSLFMRWRDPPQYNPGSTFHTDKYRPNEVQKLSKTDKIIRKDLSKKKTYPKPIPKPYNKKPFYNKKFYKKKFRY